MTNRPFDELKSREIRHSKADRQSFLQSLLQEFKRQSLQFDGVPILDGQLHYARDRRDRPGDKKIWYAAHPDKGRATFGHFRDLKKHTWTVEGCVPQTPAELRVLYDEVEAERRRIQQEKSEARVKASAQSQQEWKRATVTDVDKHNYVVSKQLRVDGLRRQGANLIVPLFNQEGKKAGIQKIDESGEKRFPKGLSSLGLSFVCGSLSENETVVVCEGVATALSIHEATALPVVGALSSNNLQNTGVQLRLKYPHRDIVVAGDDDRSAKVNVGKRTAMRLAKTIEARLALPVFTTGAGSDFNDLHVAEGLLPVKTQIESSTAVLPPLFNCATPAINIASDKAHAIRLGRAVGENWAISVNGWLHWGPVWSNSFAESIAGEVYNLAHTVKKEAEELSARGGTSNDAATRQITLDAAELRKSVEKLESSGGAGKVVKVAKDLMFVQKDELDHHSYLFAARNGIVDLRTFKFRPHRRRDWLTFTAGCDYKPDAACPKWIKFIDEVCVGDADLADFLQRLLGYVLSGMANEQILVFFYGEGRDGKGTMLQVLQQVLGAYACTAAEGVILKKRYETHSTEIADFKDRRLVVVGESDRGAQLATARAKMLSGQDTLTARRMNKDNKEFAQTHTVVWQTNNLPKTDENGKAIWRRVVIVPFDASFSKKQEDKFLRHRLKGEASGILNWLLEGLRKYKWYGLELPKAVCDASMAYRYQENAAYPFVNACCKRAKSDSDSVSSASLYKAYELWAKKSGLPVVDRNAFGRALTDLGVPESRSAESRKRRIRLKKGSE